MRHERNPFACLPAMAGKLVNTIIELVQEIARFLGVFGINTASDISKFTKISRAGIYPKYPEETVLFFVYTTRQRKFALKDDFQSALRSLRI